MPFTSDQFFEVFKNYNMAVWPLQIVFNILALSSLLLIIKKNSYSDKIVNSILSFFWLWIGIVYHLLFFTEINKAAYIFAVLFILQGLLLYYHGVIKKNITYAYKKDIYHYSGTVLILFALVLYPLIGFYFGHRFPNNPTFGLPCPTTIFTLGILLYTARNFKLYLLILPFLWSVLGVSAAINLGVYEDIGLLLSGLITFTLIMYRNRKILNYSAAKV